MDQPIAVVTRDDRLAEEVLRLALVAGSRAERWPDLAGTPRSARLVVVGPDDVPEQPTERALLVVAWSLEVAAAQRALEARALGLRRLPDDEARLLEDLRRAAQSEARGPVRVVVGVSGGAGASTVAAAAALEAPAPSVLVELDSAGGALELALGLEREPGPRWSALVAGEGHLAPEALRAALPHHGEVAVLANDGVPVPAAALDQAVEAARTGGPVVVDLPRHALVEGPWAGLDVLLVARGDLASAVAARRLAERVLRAGGSPRLLVRRGGLPLATVATVAQLGDARRLPEDRRLAQRSSRGLPSPPTPRLRRLVRAVAW